MKLSSLSIYPLKSITGIHLQHSGVTKKGLLYDRNWTLIDDNNKVITARDYPILLRLSCQLDEYSLEIYQNEQHVLSIPKEIKSNLSEEIQIFSSKANGLIYSDEINTWFSDYLGISTRLMVVDFDKERVILEKHGGKPNDIVGFADQNPLLLISEASLGELNSRLDTPVTMTHFRPNIVVSGCEPFAEDNWKYFSIGDCDFEVVQPCQRCIFTTIDPVTAQKSLDMEPLKTLSKYRKLSTGGIEFGVHVIPRKLGKVKLGDRLEL